jgi:hypothetical protein
MASAQNILLEHPTVQGPGFLKLLLLFNHDYERESKQNREEKHPEVFQKEKQGDKPKKKIKKEVSSKKSGSSFGSLPVYRFN